MFQPVYTKATTMKMVELLKRKIPLERAEYVLFAVLLLIVCLFPYPDIAPKGSGHYGFVSSHGLTLAAHLSPDRHFLMYNRILVDSRGADYYEAYNRFSIVPYALIRGAMELGGDDLFAQVTAARKLMLLFWLGAMFCIYLAFRRLGRRPFVAMTIVLLAFSSYYFLFYGDLIFNDIPALFGCMLLFHGLVVHWQENKPRQLLVKALVAVALGWQAYAMLFPAVALLQWKNRRTKENLLLAAAPLLLGVALLAFNLANECIATQTPLSETSTYRSMVHRLGVGAEEEYQITNPAYSHLLFAKYILNRAQLAATPAPATLALQALNQNVFLPLGFYVDITGIRLPSLLLGLLVLLATAGAVAKKTIPPFPASCLLALAFFWTIPMWGFTFYHEFQAIFMVGIPLIFFDALLRVFPAGSRILPLLALLTLLTMLVAYRSHVEDKVFEQRDAAVRLSALQAAADSLRGETAPVVFVEKTKERSIGGAWHTLGFTLPNARFTHDERVAQWRLLDNPLRIERIGTPDPR